MEATTEQKNTDGLIQDTPEERQGLNTITEQKNTDDSQIADTTEEIQNKDAEEREKIKTLEATNLNASKEHKKQMERTQIHLKRDGLNVQKRKRRLRHWMRQC